MGRQTSGDIHGGGATTYHLSPPRHRIRVESSVTSVDLLQQQPCYTSFARQMWCPRSLEAAAAVLLLCLVMVLPGDSRVIHHRQFDHHNYLAGAATVHLHPAVHPIPATHSLHPLHPVHPPLSPVYGQYPYSMWHHPHSMSPYTPHPYGPYWGAAPHAYTAGPFHQNPVHVLSNQSPLNAYHLHTTYPYHPMHAYHPYHPIRPISTYHPMPYHPMQPYYPYPPTQVHYPYHPIVPNYAHIPTPVNGTYYPMLTHYPYYATTPNYPLYPMTLYPHYPMTPNYAAYAPVHPVHAPYPHVYPVHAPYAPAHYAHGHVLPIPAHYAPVHPIHAPYAPMHPMHAPYHPVHPMLAVHPAYTPYAPSAPYAPSPYWPSQHAHMWPLHPAHYQTWSQEGGCSWEKPFPCWGRGTCIPISALCDKHYDCANYLDEDSRLCISGRRPAVHLMQMFFSLPAQSWMQTKLFNSRDPYYVAVAFKLAVTLGDLKWALTLSDESVNNTKVAFAAAADDDKQPLIDLGMKDDDWAITKYFFRTMADTGFVVS